MFSLTKAELAAKANELNFVRDTVEKVLRLADILDYLNNNLLTKDTLALKGGTAINLTVFNLLRLSVDLDFDYSVEQSYVELENMKNTVKGFIEKLLLLTDDEKAFLKAFSEKQYLPLFVFLFLLCTYSNSFTKAQRRGIILSFTSYVIITSNPF